MMPSAGSSNTSAAIQQPQSAAKLVQPVNPNTDTWRALVRTGLVQLVASEVPAEPAMLAETLSMDAARLHSAQNAFQQMLVLTACMLLVQQARSAAPPQQQQPTGAQQHAGPPTTQQSGTGLISLADMKRRLSAVLTDASMRLPDLATELITLAGLQHTAAQQSAMEASLNSMLVRSSGAFKALSTGLANALQLQLLAGPELAAADAALQRGVDAALARCGGMAVQAELAQLALQLAKTAATSEAVHGPVYQKLISDLV